MIVLQRPKAHYYLILTFTRAMTPQEIEQNMVNGNNDKLQEDSIVNEEETEVVVKKGGLGFEEEIKIDKKFFENRDQIFLATAGLFLLYEKYYTINQIKFKKPKLEETKGNN